jgi:uncharacterized surface protein with fasciclin (FAS1) repeats
MIVKRLAVLTAAGGLALALVACGSSSTPAASPATSNSSSSASSAAAPSGSAPMSSGAMTSGAMSSGAMSSGAMTSGGGAATALVGAGCAGYAKAVPTGAGSVGGMAADPVATAASNNPLLKTLVAAVSGKVNPKVNLVNTLNSGEFTVFAPVDTAFKKIDAATMGKLATDSALLTKILTYHVIPGQLDAKAVIGTHKTVEGGSVEVTGSGDNIKINGTSAVICGNVKTKNATVYLIDTVLTPPADGAVTSGAMTSGAMTSGAMTSGAMTSGAMTSGTMTSGAMTSGAMTSGATTSGATTSGAALVGPGCAAYAKAVPAGAGSVGGMAADPVATAASNNPLLTTLVAAVSGKVNPKVNLVNTLNSGEFTVFAPVDSAFKKVDAATMGKLTTDGALLTKILTYHVVAGQLDASKIAGTHKTVEGGSVTVTGSGNNLKVNGANVICGNVKTKNATVYLIDNVLSPTS